MIGTLDWARATDGNLTPSERRSLLAPILRAMVAYSIGRLRLALGLRPVDVEHLYAACLLYDLALLDPAFARWAPFPE